jgi:hypothetical protein
MKLAMKPSCAFVLFSALCACSASAASRASPEEQTLEIARSLKPISDSDWQMIAGKNSNLKYKIETGDTLFGISKRLFGDPSYWPKIWAMNNDTILNPHLILPGHQISFMPGTGVSLPKVSLDGSPSSGPVMLDSLTDTNRLPSNDWKNFPEKEWEYASRFKKTDGLDAITISQSVTKDFAAETSIQRPYEVYSVPLSPVADISQSPNDQENLTTGDQVFLHSRTELVEGQVYSVSPEPIKFQDPAFDNNQPDEHRTVYIYAIKGEIVAHQNSDGLWIGTITNARDFLKRGNLLIPLSPRLQPITTPIPAPSATEGHYYVDPESSYIAATGHYGLVNLGEKDGAAMGMLLQSYQSRDPVSSKKLIKQDLFDLSTLQIIQTADTFSLVRVIAGRSEIADGDLVKMLVDVSAFGGTNAPVTPTPPVTPVPTPTTPDQEALPDPNMAPTPPSDNLDKMDNEEKLGPDEERELKQLERYKPNEAELAQPSASPSPDASPSPSPAPSPSPDLSPAPPDTAPAPEPTPLPTPEATPTPDTTSAISPDEPAPVPDAPAANIQMQPEPEAPAAPPAESTSPVQEDLPAPQ